jgi:TRAP-type C4-dicarboxylate transport system permease small subunit
MKVLFLIFAAVLAIAESEEAFEINWAQVVPILSLKEFWDNNDFPVGGSEVT